MSEKMIPRRVIVYGADEVDKGAWSTVPLGFTGFHYVPEDHAAQLRGQRDTAIEAMRAAREVLDNIAALGLQHAGDDPAIEGARKAIKDAMVAVR